jgi:hypothetical protein
MEPDEMRAIAGVGDLKKIQEEVQNLRILEQKVIKGLEIHKFLVRTGEEVRGEFFWDEDRGER